MGTYADVYFAPYNGALESVIGFINRCNHTLDIAVYSITHDDISNAIIDAHNRGVKVRVIIDAAQAGLSSADDEKMEKAGIEVRRDVESGLMHHKLAIGDSNTSARAVGIGSFNWTLSAATRNRESWCVVRLSYIVAECQSEFNRVWEANKI